MLRSQPADVRKGVAYFDLFSEKGAGGDKADEEQFLRAAVAEQLFVRRIVDEIFYGREELALFEDAHIVGVGDAEEAFFLVCGGIKPDTLFADGIPPVGGGGGAGRRGGEKCRDEKEQEDEFHTRYRSASARAGGRVF